MTAQIRIEVPAAQAWDAVGTRFGDVAAWAAPITSSSLDGATATSGAVRTCHVSGFGPLGDPGSPFGRGVEITAAGRADLDLTSPSPLVGYCILNADSLDAAEKLVATMPVIDSVQIYEAHSM